MASVMASGTPGLRTPPPRARGRSLVRQPLAGADDIERQPGCAAGMAGFFGASSMEGLPTEVAITESMRRFTRVVEVAMVS